MSTEYASLRLPPELSEKVKAMAAATGTTASEVIRQALVMAVSFDPIIEGTLVNLQFMFGLSRAAVVAGILVRRFAEDAARMTCNPGEPLLFEWAARRGGHILQGKELYDLLYNRYCAFFRGQPLPDTAAEIPAVLPAQQATANPLQLPVNKDD